MALISVNNLTFNYEGSYDNVFENISFNIDSSWKLGLIGRNGVGKTTLLKLFMKEHEYRGSVVSSTPFMYFPFEIKDKSQNCYTIATNIFLDLEPWQLEKELSLLKVDNDILYRSFDTLSGGEQTKLMLAILFLQDNQFLLIDEPTNNLDQEGRKVVSDYLRSKDGFILVSHDRVFLNSTIEYTLSINKSSIEVKRGNFDSWKENKERQETFEKTQNKRLTNEIKSLEVAAKQTKRWSDKIEATKIGRDKKSGLKPDTGYIGRKSAKMMKRSKVLENRINTQLEEKQGLLKDVETVSALSMKPLSFNQEIIARFRNFSINYKNDNIINNVIKNLNMTLSSGDRYLIKGKNGSGKTSLLEILLGGEINNKSMTYTGDYFISNHIKTSYIKQMSGNLKGTIEEFVEANKIDRTLLMTILIKMGLNRVQFEKNFSDYSEGQKKKVMIASSLCKPAHLFVWDEPLNYIDVYSRMQIEETILEYSPTIIFVEHDLAFQEKVATKIINLDDY